MTEKEINIAISDIELNTNDLNAQAVSYFESSNQIVYTDNFRVSNINTQTINLNFADVKFLGSPNVNINTIRGFNNIETSFYANAYANSYFTNQLFYNTSLHDTNIINVKVDELTTNHLNADYIKKAYLNGNIKVLNNFTSDALINVGNASANDTVSNNLNATNLNAVRLNTTNLNTSFTDSSVLKSTNANADIISVNFTNTSNLNAQNGIFNTLVSKGLDTQDIDTISTIVNSSINIKSTLNAFNVNIGNTTLTNVKSSTTNTDDIAVSKNFTLNSSLEADEFVVNKSFSANNFFSKTLVLNTVEDLNSINADSYSGNLIVTDLNILSVSNNLNISNNINVVDAQSNVINATNVNFNSIVGNNLSVKNIDVGDNVFVESNFSMRSIEFDNLSVISINTNIINNNTFLANTRLDVANLDIGTASTFAVNLLPNNDFNNSTVNEYEVEHIQYGRQYNINNLNCDNFRVNPNYNISGVEYYKSNVNDAYINNLKSLNSFYVRENLITNTINAPSTGGYQININVGNFIVDTLLMPISSNEFLYVDNASFFDNEYLSLAKSSLPDNNEAGNLLSSGQAYNIFNNTNADLNNKINESKTLTNYENANHFNFYSNYWNTWNNLQNTQNTYKQMSNSGVTYVQLNSMFANNQLIQYFDVAYNKNVMNNATVITSQILPNNANVIWYRTEDNADLQGRQYPSNVVVAVLQIPGFVLASQNCNSTFFNCRNLIAAYNWLPLETTTINQVFDNCFNLNMPLQFGNSDTISSAVYCYRYSNIPSANISYLRSVPTATYEFRNCENLKTAEIHYANVNAFSNSRYLFANCNNITDITLSGPAGECDHLIDYCHNLKNLNMDWSGCNHMRYTVYDGTTMANMNINSLDWSSGNLKEFTIGLTNIFLGPLSNKDASVNFAGLVNNFNASEAQRFMVNVYGLNSFTITNCIHPLYYDRILWRCSNASNPINYFIFENCNFNITSSNSRRFDFVNATNVKTLIVRDSDIQGNEFYSSTINKWRFPINCFTSMAEPIQKVVFENYGPNFLDFTNASNIWTFGNHIVLKNSTYENCLNFNNARNNYWTLDRLTGSNIAIPNNDIVNSVYYAMFKPVADSPIMPYVDIAGSTINRIEINNCVWPTIAQQNKTFDNNDYNVGYAINVLLTPKLTCNGRNNTGYLDNVILNNVYFHYLDEIIGDVNAHKNIKNNCNTNEFYAYITDCPTFSYLTSKAPSPSSYVGPVWQGKTLHLSIYNCSNLAFEKTYRDDVTGFYDINTFAVFANNIDKNKDINRQIYLPGEKVNYYYFNLRNTNGIFSFENRWLNDNKLISIEYGSSVDQTDSCNSMFENSWLQLCDLSIGVTGDVNHMFYNCRFLTRANVNVTLQENLANVNSNIYSPVNIGHGFNNTFNNCGWLTDFNGTLAISNIIPTTHSTTAVDYNNVFDSTFRFCNNLRNVNIKFEANNVSDSMSFRQPFKNTFANCSNLSNITLDLETQSCSNMFTNTFYGNNSHNFNITIGRHMSNCNNAFNIRAGQYIQHLFNMNLKFLQTSGDSYLKTSLDLTNMLVDGYAMYDPSSSKWNHIDVWINNNWPNKSNFVNLWFAKSYDASMRIGCNTQNINIHYY